MAVTINASTTTGLVQSADTSGIIELQNNGTTKLTVNSSGATIPTATVTTLNTPTGVLATQNGMTGIAKAWVQFAGSTGTINGSFNVSSITVNTTGDYTVNFTTAMSNINYAVTASVSPSYASQNMGNINLFSNPAGTVEQAPTTSAFRFYISDYTNTRYNPKYVCVSVQGS